MRPQCARLKSIKLKKMANTFISPTDVVRAVGEKLYAFNAAKELAWAWNAQENIILYGKGGYGKSDAAVLFAELLFRKGYVQNPNPFILAFGQGMTEEKLLGGMDIKKFQDEGEIIYNLKNAFVSSEIVIFEELWDAFPAVLLILKDILQSRSVRMGNQVMPIKTKIVIACTNRSREEVVTDNSTAALLERFVFEKEVGWNAWEMDDYCLSFMAATGANKITPEMEMVATICANSCTDEIKISPRTAGKALKSVMINGVECLVGFPHLSEKAKILIKHQEEIKQDLKMINNIEKNMERIRLALQESTNSAMYWMRLHEEIARLENNMILPDNLMDKKPLFKSMYASLREAALEKAKKLIVNPKYGTIYYEFLHNPFCM